MPFHFHLFPMGVMGTDQLYPPLTFDLKREIDVFGNKCLHSIMGYHWNDFVSNQRLLRETESRPITSIVYQCQLRLYGYVAHYPEADPASRVISERDNLE